MRNQSQEKTTGLWCAAGARISQSSLIKLDYFHQHLEKINGALGFCAKFITYNAKRLPDIKHNLGEQNEYYKVKNIDVFGVHVWQYWPL